jgi:ketosteroid isomerase-like protein
MEGAVNESNVELVRSLYATWSRGDVEAFLQVLAPDVEWRFADNFIYGAINPAIGRDALREGSLRRLKTEWDDFDAILEDMLDAGDHVIGLGHYVGRYKLTRHADPGSVCPYLDNQGCPSHEMAPICRHQTIRRRCVGGAVSD